MYITAIHIVLHKRQISTFQRYTSTEYIHKLFKTNSETQIIQSLHYSPDMEFDNLSLVLSSNNNINENKIYKLKNLTTKNTVCFPLKYSCYFLKH